MQHLSKYQDYKAESIQASDFNRLKGLKYEFKDKNDGSLLIDNLPLAF